MIKSKYSEYLLPDEYITVSKKDIKELIQKVTQECLNSYNSPFTDVKIKSNDFIISKEDIEIKKLKKAHTRRGFISFISERITRELIDFLQNKKQENQK